MQKTWENAVPLKVDGDSKELSNDRRASSNSRITEQGFEGILGVLSYASNSRKNGPLTSYDEAIVLQANHPYRADAQLSKSKFDLLQFSVAFPNFKVNPSFETLLLSPQCQQVLVPQYRVVVPSIHPLPSAFQDPSSIPPKF